MTQVVQLEQQGRSIHLDHGRRFGRPVEIRRLEVDAEVPQADRRADGEAMVDRDFWSGYHEVIEPDPEEATMLLSPPKPK